MKKVALLVRGQHRTSNSLNSVVEALRRSEDVMEIDLDSLGDDAEAWDGALTQILESEQCVCI